VTFNHGVEGSSPSALTMKSGITCILPGSPKRSVSANALRRAMAFPFYVVALMPSQLGDALGILAAKIAGD
jgi:hypothetical protein